MRWPDFAVFGVRTIIILFWVGVLALLLSVPRFISRVLPEKSINVFCWPALIDVDLVKKFEDETGIKVYLSYFESNDELFSKLQASKGAGYDLITPSDYMLALLIKENLIKQYDPTRFAFFDRINPQLCGQYFDPSNLYSAPYFWTIYGLGVCNDYFSEHPFVPSWRLIFDPSVMPSSVGMLDGARETVLIAAQYLFGESKDLSNADDIQKIKSLLLAQKERVEAYTEMGAEYLLISKSTPVVVTSAADLLRVKRIDERFEFVTPQEGGFILIDSFAIPIGSQKDDFVYKFLDFLYRADVILRHQEKFGMCSPLKEANLDSESVCPQDESFKKMKFFRSNITEQTLHDIWVTLMAS